MYLFCKCEPDLNIKVQGASPEKLVNLFDFCLKFRVIFRLCITLCLLYALNKQSHLTQVRGLKLLFIVIL